MPETSDALEIIWHRYYVGNFLRQVGLMLERDILQDELRRHETMTKKKPDVNPTPDPGTNPWWPCAPWYVVDYITYAISIQYLKAGETPRDHFGYWPANWFETRKKAEDYALERRLDVIGYGLDSCKDRLADLERGQRDHGFWMTMSALGLLAVSVVIIILAVYWVPMLLMR